VSVMERVVYVMEGVVCVTAPFFNHIKEEDSYCNFLKLHLVKSHRKVWKR